MRLEVLSPNELVLGRVVILLSPEENNLPSGELRLIESFDEESIRLAPASILFGDDEVSEVVPWCDLATRLRDPILEPGDRILFQGRLGTVTDCAPNDIHVYIVLDDMPDKKLYTNFIHLDFSLSLKTCAKKLHHNAISSC